MGMPTEHLALNENCHTELCRLKKFFTTNQLLFSSCLTTILWAKEKNAGKHSKKHINC